MFVFISIFIFYVQSAVVLCALSRREFDYYMRLDDGVHAG